MIAETYFVISKTASGIRRRGRPLDHNGGLIAGESAAASAPIIPKPFSAGGFLRGEDFFLSCRSAAAVPRSGWGLATLCLHRITSCITTKMAPRASLACSSVTARGPGRAAYRFAAIALPNASIPSEAPRESEKVCALASLCAVAEQLPAANRNRRTEAGLCWQAEPCVALQSAATGRFTSSCCGRRGARLEGRPASRIL